MGIETISIRKPQLQFESFELVEPPIYPRKYGPALTLDINNKGVLDVDTVKGCTLGMSKYPDGGCYGECYAYKIAKRYGIDFTASVSRRIMGQWHKATLCILMSKLNQQWYRIGVMGDPCHDWGGTLTVLRAFKPMNRIPVIVTKHWITLTDDQIKDFKWAKVVMNTSISALDNDSEIDHRLGQWHRLEQSGLRSILRVVTCSFGVSEWGRIRKEKQDYLLSLKPIIDNPLRPSKNNPRVLSGDLLVTTRCDSIGGGKIVSLHSPKVYLGGCDMCPDQCGIGDIDMEEFQTQLFNEKIEFEYVKSVIGSGYEEDVAKLALEDGIAHRAARKNMQIHSAVILKIDDEFAGFMTFQVNDVCKEFCVLQSVIKPEKYTDDLYKKMVLKVLGQNSNEYPAIMTTDPRSKFETPKLFQSLGFQTYLETGGFHYMVHGNLEDVRMKLLAHITMTNIWKSTGKYWGRIKKEWNERIAEMGEKYKVVNPTFASREGCWQGEKGFANVVTGHSHNGNASVLDPTACEIILRFFMPTNGNRIYNPFGGGVQFGFISGSYGYEYLASEIRQNQCDANNKLCQDFNNVKWVKSDSSIYEPEGMFDLCFCCPPYYRVEKYIDYDGNSPDGEINILPTYEEFKNALFAGYERSLKHLNDNCFFVVMTGDSRDAKGGYRCSEADTELFLKSQGLSIYNRIVYLEPEFTRLAQAKKTLNYRKFPKAEQKIIIAFKGDTSKIREFFSPIGRL